MTHRFSCTAVCAAFLFITGGAAATAQAEETALPEVTAQSEETAEFLSQGFANKTYDELTSAELTAAKAVARKMKIESLRVCADPGNMPLSNDKGEGFDNKIIEIVAKELGAKIIHFWRPQIDRGLTRQTFDNFECDVLLGMPAGYDQVLTTTPIYRTPYVFVSREEDDIDIEGFDDPRLKELRLGVYQHSGLRLVLAKHGITDELDVHVLSHDADLQPEKQPWRQVQQVVDGEIDIAGVFGPFAGFLKTLRGEEINIQPVNLMDDEVPLEFNLALGVQPTNIVLKYMLDDALERGRDEIKDVLNAYGVPLVQCSNCVVSGDLPSHGTYFTDRQEKARKLYLTPLSANREGLQKDKASPDQVVTETRLDEWLDDGADLNEELSNAVVGTDRERVAFLLERGADIDSLNLMGLAPLHTAARERDSDMIAFLLDKGADPNLADRDGWTPLLHAAFRNHVPSIEALAKGGADLDKAAPSGVTPLAIAIMEAKFFAANALMDAGAKLDEPVGAERLTPLMMVATQPLKSGRAARFNQGASSVDVARRLIEGGADVDARSTKGVTPLMIAATHNNPPLIGLLLQAGADPDVKTPGGQTALDIAKANQSEAAILQLELPAKIRAPATNKSERGVEETPKKSSAALMEVK
ncbi:quinoprotein dehydrogenase-associated putative ABC transporter substrate-binding protein [Methyloceanibacter sp. wino2]|uniref:quinoprotein dehydrogenase-associated putative ABC transporter substrate-binding protein n=1 Tax=Methyloceanibacter sp. wino2 TaxID=2170729 RepID=UPI000D3EBDED|nr:quinoprotein dehydrogenase-associated putative ABC transporter substrate-binding protein [Methyloceanibacter sp. wino2]